MVAIAAMLFVLVLLFLLLAGLVAFCDRIISHGYEQRHEQHPELGKALMAHRASGVADGR